ncbi:hypothetical protein Tco_0263494, partial [Tanacetum coccineum]
NNMDTFLFHFTKPPDHCSKGESILTVRESRTDLEDLTKYFSVNSELSLIQLELVCICIFDLLDGVPELMHIYFRNFSNDQESMIAGSEFKNRQSDLKCGFSL